MHVSETGFEKAALIDAPPGWRWQTRVRFQDIDAAGIVFYPRILEYFHDAYVELLSVRGVALDAALRDRRWLAPIKHAEADFLAPLSFGDVVDVELVRALVAGSVLTLGWRASAGGRAVAVGHTVHVFVDARFQKVPVPEAVAAAFASMA